MPNEDKQYDDTNRGSLWLAELERDENGNRQFANSMTGSFADMDGLKNGRIYWNVLDPKNPNAPDRAVILEPHYTTDQQEVIDFAERHNVRLAVILPVKTHPPGEDPKKGFAGWSTKTHYINCWKNDNGGERTSGGGLRPSVKVTLKERTNGNGSTAKQSRAASVTVDDIPF